jgi:hypothetical protein
MKIDNDITQKIKDALNPKGLLPITRLHLNNEYFNSEFVDKCLGELNTNVVADLPLSPLQRLALIVLCDSASLQNLDEPVRNNNINYRLDCIFDAIENARFEEAENNIAEMRADIGEHPDLVEAEALISHYTRF